MGYVRLSRASSNPPGKPFNGQAGAEEPVRTFPSAAALELRPRVR